MGLRSDKPIHNIDLATLPFAPGGWVNDDLERGRYRCDRAAQQRHVQAPVGFPANQVAAAIPRFRVKVIQAPWTPMALHTSLILSKRRSRLCTPQDPFAIIPSDNASSICCSTMQHELSNEWNYA
jgi:hypothetical protein